MKWLRSNIRHGTRLALFALAVQFALSFGHFHAVSAQTSTASQSAAAQVSPDRTSNLLAADTASESAQRQSPSNHDSDQQSGDSCAICAVIALANTALFATPPVLLLPQAVELLRLVTDTEFGHLNSASVAFQPRAPPLS
jgi:predicted lysophospholipase L1 biosynthesis ABC-type transport system permease subunit